MLLRFIGEEPDCGPWEWDDFTSVRAAPELEPFRQHLLMEVDPLLGHEDKREAVRTKVLEMVADVRSAT
jgi:hypothetical protein